MNSQTRSFPHSFKYLLDGLVCSVLLLSTVQAQTFIKLHDFSGPEGKLPIGTLAVDAAGNLYGTASAGGINENGTVFKLTKHNSTWMLTTLYRFVGGSDGSGPSSGVMLAPDGTLYGTTAAGGGGGCYGYGCGTVFRLTPPVRPCASLVCPLMETVLYRFTGGDDGSEPYGKVVFGPDGGLYGTTTGYPWGGPPGARPQLPLSKTPSFSCNSGFGGNCGNVYKLTPSGSGWTESVLWSFNTTDGDDATHPYSEVIFDKSGKLYGTTYGNDGESVVYQLAPSDSGWTETALCRLDVEPIYSKNASAGLIFDGSGDLVGATSLGFIPPSGGVPFMVYPGGGCDWFGQQLSWGGTV